MFTGIIEAVGQITEHTLIDGDLAVTIAVGKLDMSDVKLGDSIASNGVCLTVVKKTAHSFSADVSKETLKLTQFAHYAVGQTVNLEKALTPSTRLGGHLVSGHVDGVAEVVRITPNARATDYYLKAPSALLPYLAYKGSVCIDGISLTINGIESDVFKLTIVPHTAAETTIAEFKVGSRVNLEVDQIARYLEQLMRHQYQQAAPSEVSMALLAKAGFLK